MICKNCTCCKKGFFADAPDKHVCIGVPEPFVIEDVNAECTEAFIISKATKSASSNTPNIHRYKIELVTMKDVSEFTKTVEGLAGRITLTNGDDFRINAKSLLGAMATVEWDNLFCESENDIYKHIKKFCV